MPTPSNALFLWVNLIDLARVESIDGTAVPLMQLLADEEKRMPGAYTRLDDDIDNTWIVIKTFGWTRAGILADGMNILTEKTLGRRLRTLITTLPPDTSWTWILEGILRGRLDV